jgi:RNA polymerase sigma factor (sigma-70 family)
VVENNLRNLSDQRKPDGLVKQLAEECGSELLRFISRRLRSVVDPQDLAQETYVRLLRLERKDLIRDPRPYLFRIAANILYEFELSRKSDIAAHTRWSAEQDLDSEFGLVEESVESLGLRKHLESALRGLSPKCRAVVILHRRDGMTYEEIAAEIGMSRSMVKKYLAQGLLHCRGRLKDYR